MSDEDRRELDQVDEVAGPLPDEPDQAQDIEVAGRVVVEEGPVVEPVEALLGEVRGPVPGTSPGRPGTPSPDSSYARMTRKTRPSARIATIAPMPSRVPLVRVGASAPRLGPSGARPDVTGWISRTSVEVDRRVAQGRSPLASPNSYPSSTFVTVVGAACLVAIALVVYTVSHPDRFYNHFTWQAMAFLEGQAAIRYPVPPAGASLGNAFFQDVLPVASSDGVARALVPFPPLPAVLLLPFVALWGLATNGQLIFAVLGALDVGLAWWALGYLPVPDVGPRGRERLLRLRDGLLVRRPARDDLVPGPRPGGRPWPSWRSASPCARDRGGRVPRRRAGAGRGPPATPRATTPRRARPRAGARHAASPGSSRTAARSSPASSSAWPARPGSRSSSPRRSSSSSAAAARGCGAAGPPALGAGIPLGRPRRLQPRDDRYLLHPGYQYLYELEAGVLPAAELPHRVGDRGHPLSAPEFRDHVPEHARSSCRTSSRRPSARAGRCARAPSPSAACSTPTAR